MHVKTVGNVSTVYADGKFTFHQHKEFRAMLDAAFAKTPDQLIVDLSLTTYLDSAALGMLLIARDKFSGNVVLKGARGPVMNVLTIASFQKIFSFID